MNATGWSRGLEVTGGGTGVVSHAGLVLLRELADRTGLTAGLSAALPSPAGGHDRGRVFADLACAIADGARVISDFRVMGDQRELFGPVASVPTAWRALKEAAAGGDRARRKVTAAVNRARRHAWAQAGPLPPVRIADRVLEGVTCIRLDATVVPAHSDKELAEANFKGYGHHPLLAACDNTGEPLAWMLRPGSAGSATRPPITCGCSARRSRPCRRRCDAGSWSPATGPAPATSWSKSSTGSPPGTGTRSPGPSAGRWAPASRPRSARSPGPPGRPPSTARARSASAARMRPARTRAARIPPAGSRKRTSPS